MKLKLVIAALALSAMNVANAGLINGDFESGALGPWIASGNVAITQKNQPNFYQGAGSAEQDGLWAVVFNAGSAPANGVLYQDFVTVAGTTYRLAFDFGATSKAGSQSLLASARNGSTVLAQYTATDHDINPPLTSFAMDFVASGALTRIQFNDVMSNQNSAAVAGVLDNVAVSVIVPAVPEPASMGLIGLGLVALGTLRRKRAA